MNDLEARRDLTGDLEPEANLVYGLVWGDEMIVMGRQQAHDWADGWAANRQAKTWRELKDRVSPGLWAEVQEGFDALEEDGEDIPALDDAREPLQIPAHDESDGWPEFPKYMMLRWFPQDLIDEYGELNASMTGLGDWLDLKAADAPAIVAALAEHGYTCERDDDLIARALGQLDG